MKTILLYSPPETHACAYLPDREAVSLYADPRHWLNNEELSHLNRLGFRRSGRLVYRPNCPACNECTAVRVTAKDMRYNRTMKRKLIASKHIQLSVESAHSTDEHYQLFEQYINQRHHDGDMYPPSRQQFNEFLTEHFGNTYFLNARIDGVLVGCMVFDVFDDGVSSVYCFYQPKLESLSLGTVLICRLTQLAVWLGLEFNYLGYLVKDCRKMAYKEQYSPLQAWRNDKWIDRG